MNTYAAPCILLESMVAKRAPGVPGGTARSIRLRAAGSLADKTSSGPRKRGTDGLSANQTRRLPCHSRPQENVGRTRVTTHSSRRTGYGYVTVHRDTES
jgi:hypothetical protein